MPSQVMSSVENNFTKGLITESTGMNFPENAATDTDNCIYTLVGDVTRREGFNFEDNAQFLAFNAVGAHHDYVWNNAGGDGSTEVVVRQIANNLYFYLASASTVQFPLSNQLLPSIIDVSQFVSVGNTFDSSIECDFASGNGYLFIYHPDCDPSYCTYNLATHVVAALPISVQIRDFTGVPESNPVNLRPTTLSQEHLYNLTNQGWTSGNPWSTTSNTSYTIGLGAAGFVVSAGLTVNLGDAVALQSNNGAYQLAFPNTVIASGTVTAYSGTSMTLNITSIAPGLSGISFTLGGGIQPYNGLFTQTSPMFTIYPTNHGYIDAWHTAEGNYPSNADVWWYFKNTSGAFDPATTQANVTLNTGKAPQGHWVLNAFSQDRSTVSSVSGITKVSTMARPRTGTWFAGRVWYAGVDDTQAATGDAGQYAWTENLYFSQIVATVSDFGNCYQTNDPTSETLFDLLPTDGGVITIQGCGAIYKLFPIQNGMLVFASNGVWFVTGSQGIGFAANDYTITKLSQVQSISGSSFVDVLGLPYFWNEEGIYMVAPQKTGGLSVDPITVGTILTFYNAIPFASRKYARGSYNPVEYTIQWAYKSVMETGVSDRYKMDRILNFNTYNKAFFPYTISQSANQSSISGVFYLTYPTQTASTPEPGYKYPASFVLGGTNEYSYAEENDEGFIDWTTQTYNSYFITGFKLTGDAWRKFQMPYYYLYFRTNDERNACYVQGLWDYATSGDSGRWSTNQIIDVYKPNYSVVHRRVIVRGRGYALQIKVSSVDNLPFDIIGWAVYDTVNQGA